MKVVLLDTHISKEGDHRNRRGRQIVLNENQPLHIIKKRRYTYGPEKIQELERA